MYFHSYWRIFTAIGTRRFLSSLIFLSAISEGLSGSLCLPISSSTTADGPLSLHFSSSGYELPYFTYYRFSYKLPTTFSLLYSS